MIKFKGINWYYYQGALLPQVPPHFEVYLTQKEEKELLKESRALFLRYTNEWDREDGAFWYVIKDTDENLNDYSSKKRYDIKKGLKNCIVKKVSGKEIALYGYDVYVNAFENYNTDLKKISKNDFYKNYINNKEYDFFAVYEKIEDKKEGKMIGYSQNKIDSTMVHYSSIKFHPNYQYLYPSYALFFEMNRYYLNENNFLYVSDGAKSIAHDTNIQGYLISKFNFRKAYVKLNIAYRWDIAFIVKLIYPFRRYISKLKYPLIKKILVILNQEKIKRSFV